MNRSRRRKQIKSSSRINLRIDIKIISIDFGGISRGFCAYSTNPFSCDVIIEGKTFKSMGLAELIIEALFYEMA